MKMKLKKNLRFFLNKSLITIAKCWRGAMVSQVVKAEESQLSSL
jgi:hypothetical protein